MAVVAMEGFDHYSGAQITANPARTGASIAVTTGRLGGQAASIDGGGNITLVLPATYTTLYLGVAYYGDYTLNNNIIEMKQGATIVCRLVPVTSGPNKVWRILNAGGTTLATGTTPLINNAWQYVELKCIVSATVGAVELRLNGSSTAECSATSVDTGALAIDSVAGRGPSSGNLYDDIYVVDTTGSSPTNTWLGDVRVETLAPTGDGANTAWTGTYTDIDDATSHDTDTTYISSATPGDRETSTLADVSVATGTVFAVQTNLTARKDDAGARTIAPVIRISGVNYDGTTTAGLTTGYLDYTQLYDRLDPAGNAWTISTVNGMEAGVKEVT